MRFKRINDFAVNVIDPMIKHIIKTKKSSRMPWKEIEAILKILYPDTKCEPVCKGCFKHVFVIYTDTRWLALKIGRKAQDIRKDFYTYENLPRTSRNRYYAKIYWATDIFMLQKWGERVYVPSEEFRRLKAWGHKRGLKDISRDNIMKVDGRFKIVDAERA